MLIASIIAIVISFLLLGHYSQKWILTRVLYSLILIFVINLMAALVAVIYLDPSLDPTTIMVSSIKLSDIVKPLLIIFVMLIAYSLYYLYKTVISPKKMPRWCWLLILLFCVVTSTFYISQTVRYINRSSFFTPYPDRNSAIYINSPSSQEQGYTSQRYAKESSYIQGIYFIEIKGNALKILTAENGIQYLKIGEKILFPVIGGSYEVTYLGQEGEKLNFYYHGLSHTWANNNENISVNPYTLKEYFKNRGYYGVYGLFELIYYLRKNQNEETMTITQQLKDTLQNAPKFSVGLVCMPHGSIPDRDCVSFITNLISN